MSHGEIEKNIPMPTRGQNKRRSDVWERLEVGDSVPFDLPISSVTSQATKAGKRLGRTFSARTMRDGSVRVWRTA